MRIKTAIGQDSHRFEEEHTEKQCVIGGIVFDDVPALAGNSDADVVLHAITNAVSGITGRNILGEVADKMCRKGITDSREYLKVGLADLSEYRISNISISIEGKRPKISPKIEAMKETIAGLLYIDKSDVGITATSGEGITAFGRGEGVQAFVILTVMKS
ncbi:MAG: 2-C-methyl-D-erythritol 2,4-cyclodiphosphate synthase [Fidelibacterota bacterium]